MSYSCTIIYKEIWSIVYLSLIGYYDFAIKNAFVMAVKHKYREWKDKNNI